MAQYHAYEPLHGCMCDACGAPAVAAPDGCTTSESESPDLSPLPRGTVLYLCREHWNMAGLDVDELVAARRARRAQITRDRCEVCGKGREDGNLIHEWRRADANINLPWPPDDLRFSGICQDCYRDGATMEARILDARRRAQPKAAPTHSETAIWRAQALEIWRAQALEDATAAAEGRKPRLIATMEDIERCSAPPAVQCSVCGSSVVHRYWTGEDALWGVKPPPPDCEEAMLCEDCYREHGPHLAEAIRDARRHVEHSAAPSAPRELPADPFELPETP